MQVSVFFFFFCFFLFVFFFFFFFFVLFCFVLLSLLKNSRISIFKCIFWIIITIKIDSQTLLTLAELTCADFLGQSVKKINYWNSNVGILNKTPSKRPRRRRKLSPQNELFLGLVFCTKI